MNRFIGVAVLAGLTAISNGAFAQDYHLVTNGENSIPNNSDPQSPVPEVKPQQKGDLLRDFSTFLKKRNLKIFVDEALSLLESSEKISDYVKQKGILPANFCTGLNSEDVLSVSKSLKAEFKQSFENLSHSGEVRPEIKDILVHEFDDVMDTFEKNSDFLRSKCLNPGLER